MTELEFALAAFAFLFFLSLLASCAKMSGMYEEINRLTGANAKLKNAVRQQKAECDELKKKLSQPPEQNITALNRTIFLQKETIDELRVQVAQQKKLLDQKWRGAKKNVQIG